jgi:putative ABC transport system permease protein
MTTNLPLVGERSIGFVIEGDAAQVVNTSYNAWVSNDYFRALGIELRAGRGFSDQDREGAPPVVVINEKMQRHFWPNGDAIGKRIMWGGWSKSWLTIVGVVSDVKVSSLEAETGPAIYMPIFQIPRARDSVIYVVRSTTDAAGVAATLRREIRAVDVELPVYDIRTMDQVIADSVSQRRFSMLLLAVFAVAAILLAATGLYGVMSFTVSQRTHKIGMRMALGARQLDVLKLVVRQGMTLVVVGIGLGLFGAFTLTRVMATLLFGVTAKDPMTFAAVTTLLTLVAFVACYLPARRATKVDPLVALRYE